MRYFFILTCFLLPVQVVLTQDITWYKDIEPLIQNKCASCHHEGGGAPFTLLTYEDVNKRASFIREVVTTRYMPPWRPDKNYTHFANDRSLKLEEIDLISKWIDNKKPKGKPLKETKTQAPVFTQTKY